MSDLEHRIFRPATPVNDLERQLAKDVEDLVRRAAPAIGAVVVVFLKAVDVYARLQDAAAMFPGKPQAREILGHVAKVTGVSVSRLTGPGRDLTTSRARDVAMWALRTVCGLSSTEVGKVMGRDHSTVLSAQRRFVARTTLASKTYSISAASDRARVVALCQGTASESCSCSNGCKSPVCDKV